MTVTYFLFQLFIAIFILYIIFIFRRLYSWLLGSEINISLLHSDHPLVKYCNSSDNKNHTEKYFELYSFDILVEAIQIILAQSSTKTTIDIKPYRLLTSLLDKPQIGPVILDTILYDVFRALYLTCLSQANTHNHVNGRCVSFTGDIASLKYGNTFGGKSLMNKDFLNKYCQELIKNANLLFHTLEAYYVWNYLGKMYEVAVMVMSKDPGTSKAYQVNDIGSGNPNVLELCTLADFLLDIIPIETYIDNTSEILPNLFVNIISIMKENIKTLNKQQITQSLELCTKILTKIQPVVVKNIAKNIEPVISEHSEVQKVNEVHAEVPKEINTILSSVPNLENDGSIINSIESEMGDSKELKFGAQLEKSKSDSKINENSLGSELNNLNRERSNSNQMVKNKKTSPRIDKKSKNKKSKSSSKLYDLKKEEQSETSSSTEIISPENTLLNNESSAPQDIVITSIHVQLKTENKHILKCLKLYKKFYVTFIITKILPDVNINKIFEKLLYNTDNRTKELEEILQKCLEGRSEFCPKSINDFKSSLEFMQISHKLNTPSCDYNVAMRLASNLLLEFNTFPDVLEERTDECEIPYWLKALIVCGCFSQKHNQEIQMIAMNTLLEMLSLAKAQNFERDKNDNNTEVVVMGVLEGFYVNYIENYTYVIEVSLK